MYSSIDRDGQWRQIAQQGGNHLIHFWYAARSLVRLHLRLCLLLVLLAALPVTLAAATSTEYEIVAYSVVGGGGASESEEFSLVGSVGQPTSGESSGGDFTLDGGFSLAVDDLSPEIQQLYLPQVSR